MQFEEIERLEHEPVELRSSTTFIWPLGPTIEGTIQKDYKYISGLNKSQNRVKEGRHKNKTSGL